MNKFDDFCKKFGEDAGTEILERICDAQWNNGKGEGINFSDIHQHNACNHTLSGSIEYQGEIFHFIINNGDWGGTEVIEFGTIDEVGVYYPPPQTMFDFVPKSKEDPDFLKLYERWKKEEWFKKKLSSYHYDRHFQPGHKIEQHYKEWADKFRLKIEEITQ